MLTTFIDTLMSAEADAVCGAEYEAVVGVVLSGLVAAAAPAGGAGADHGGGDLLPARGLDAADGAPGRVAGDHQAEQVAGLEDGSRPRRPGRGLPHPAIGRRPVHVRGGRRPGAQGA